MMIVEESDRAVCNWVSQHSCRQGYSGPWGVANTCDWYIKLI